MMTTRRSGCASCAAMPNGMPTPRVPSGPGSIQAPSPFTGRILAAVATMSPPSPITIGSSSVASQSRTSRNIRCGSRGDSSLSRFACTFTSAASSIARSASRQPEKSSFAPRFFISSQSSSNEQPRLPTNATSAWRFWPINVASISSWMIFASAGMFAPKRMRKSSRVPASTMQSICFIASRRERFRNSGESTGTLPRAMPFV